jgi:hypothetical protein
MSYLPNIMGVALALLGRQMKDSWDYWVWCGIACVFSSRILMLRILGNAGVALLRGLAWDRRVPRCSVSLEPLVNRGVMLGFIMVVVGLQATTCLGFGPPSNSSPGQDQGHCCRILPSCAAEVGMALESCLVLGRGHMHLVPVMIEWFFLKMCFGTDALVCLQLANKGRCGGRWTEEQRYFMYKR